MLTKKILEFESVSLPSINDKFGVRKDKKGGPILYAKNNYIKFKDDVTKYCLIPSHFDSSKPFSLDIHTTTYADIDSCLKPLLDGIAIKIGFNDKDIKCLHVYKTTGKKGGIETLRVFLNYEG